VITLSFDLNIQSHLHVESLQLAAGRLDSVLLSLFNTLPQLYVLLSDTETQSRLLMCVNDSEVLESTDLTSYLLAPGDTLALLLVPAGEAAAVGAFITEVAVQSGMMSATTWAAISVTAEMLIGGLVIMGAMMALSALMGTLVTDLEMPSIYSGSLDNSATYTFTGIKNTTASGTPIPIIYGTHRTGGHVLSLFTESVDTTLADASKATSITNDTYLYYQLGLSEGVIENVEAVEINKMPSTFFNGTVVCEHQTGTSNNLVMNGFNKITNTTTVSRKVISSGLPLVNTEIEFSEYEPIYAAIYSSRGIFTSRLTKADYHPGPYKLEVTSEEVTTYDGGGG